VPMVSDGCWLPHFGLSDFDRAYLSKMRPVGPLGKQEPLHNVPPEDLGTRRAHLEHPSAEPQGWQVQERSHAAVRFWGRWKTRSSIGS
jgi:hypothetical protein